MPRCAIGLGGNQGDVAAAFATALHRLAESHCTIVAVSRLYVTRAVGPQAGADFQNACALIDTDLTPHDLLDVLQQLEHDAGRTPNVRWGSRPLDLDLLTYGNQVLHDPRLTIPHPGLVYRRFVLDPLAEIAPDLVHPVLRRSIADLERRLQRPPLRIALRGGTDTQRHEISAQLVRRFAQLVQLPSGDLMQTGVDETVIERASDDVAPQRPSADSVVVTLDQQLAQQDPIAATVAIVTAMLDVPEPVGDLPLAGR